MQVDIYNQVENKIFELNHQKVILDIDVAAIYGVETKHINQAVSRNLDKFPHGYIIEFTQTEWDRVKSQFVTSPLGGGKVKLPKAFTECGLYMLATILKSKQSTEATLAIIDTFAKVREIGRIVGQLPTLKENSPQQQKLMQKAGDIISELVVPEEMETEGTEASIELNLAMVKFKYSVKRKPKK